MPLTAWQQMILDKSRENGGQGTVQEMLRLGGLELNTANFAKANEILAGAGISAPQTIAENQARLAREAVARGGTKPLTPYQQKEYENMQAGSLNTGDIAAIYNSIGYPLKESEVADILAGAGIKPPKAKPGGSLGEKPTSPALTPMPPEYEGGMPGRQADGLGMYGGTPTTGINTPGAQMPQHPQLRSIWGDIRRRGKPGYKGQTDTILTSARGVNTMPLLRKKVLTGS